MRSINVYLFVVYCWLMIDHGLLFVCCLLWFIADYPRSRLINVVHRPYMVVVWLLVVAVRLWLVADV